MEFYEALWAWIEREAALEIKRTFPALWLVKKKLEFEIIWHEKEQEVWSPEELDKIKEHLIKIGHIDP